MTNEFTATIFFPSRIYRKLQSPDCGLTLKLRLDNSRNICQTFLESGTNKQVECQIIQMDISAQTRAY